ncbi:hypothetical protein HJFPF1_09418 [Paramyrothecium foliicola]|nr:hypothetical protein HJFPF1_09418 [Paramyrothecium foliicola]
MSSASPLPPLTPAQEAETNLPRIMGITAAFHFLALSFVAVRLYIRFFIIKAPKLDDVFMILATLGAFGGMICIILQAPRGLGRHRQIITDDNFKTLRLLNWVYSLSCVVVCFSLLKISIALSLLRLSRVRWYVYSLYALIACSMFSDVVCATLPIPIIWTLQMKLRTRIYLVIVLSLGYFTVGMGGVKAYWQIGAKRDPDSWFEHNIQFYGFLQFNLGIIVACAPTLRPLLGRALKLSSRDKFSGGYYADSRSRKTGKDASKRRTATHAQDFELDDASGFDSNQQVHTTIRGESTIYEKRNADHSGSEELILQQTEPKGILKTTEIDMR